MEGGEGGEGGGRAPPVEVGVAEAHFSNKTALFVGNGSLGFAVAPGARGSCMIAWIDPALRGLARRCLFVGDTVLAVDNQRMVSGADLAEALQEKNPGEPLRLRLYQPVVARHLSGWQHEAPMLSLWVEALQVGAGEMTEEDAVGYFDRLNPSGRPGKHQRKGGTPDRPAMELVQPGTPQSKGGSKPSSPWSTEAVATAEHVAEQAAIAEAREAAAAEAAAATLLVIGSQRVRLLKVRVESTHRGLLHPTLVATLSKRAGHGKPLPNKWTPRRFELKGSSLHYYATNKPQAPRGSIQLSGPLRSSEIVAVESSTPEMYELTIASADRPRPVRLRAPDAATRDEWVAALRGCAREPEEPLLTVEDVACSTWLEHHLLELRRIDSADGLRSTIRLAFAGGGGNDGSGSAGGGSAVLVRCVPAKRVGRVMVASWARLTTFLGVPPRGFERDDGWLSPASLLTSLPMRTFDLVWVPAVAAATEVVTEAAEAATMTTEAATTAAAAVATAAVVEEEETAAVSAVPVATATPEEEADAGEKVVAKEEAGAGMGNEAAVADVEEAEERATKAEVAAMATNAERVVGAALAAAVASEQAEGERAVAPPSVDGPLPPRPVVKEDAERQVVASSGQGERQQARGADGKIWGGLLPLAPLLATPSSQAAAQRAPMPVEPDGAVWSSWAALETVKGYS